MSRGHPGEQHLADETRDDRGSHRAYTRHGRSGRTLIGTGDHRAASAACPGRPEHRRWRGLAGPRSVPVALPGRWPPLQAHRVGARRGRPLRGGQAASRWLLPGGSPHCLTACPGLGRLRRGHQPPGRGPDAHAGRARCRPRPPLVRAPCPSRCPRARSGRDAMAGPAPDDRLVPAAVTPGHRRAEDAIPVARLPHARATPTWAWHGWPPPAFSPPRPGRAVGPPPAGCGRPARPGPDRAGMPVRAEASQTTPRVWVCRNRCGPVRRPLPRLPRGPGTDGLTPGASPGRRPGLAKRLAGRPVCPLRAAISPHRPSDPLSGFFRIISL